MLGSPDESSLDSGRGCGCGFGCRYAGRMAGPANWTVVCDLLVVACLRKGLLPEQPGYNRSDKTDCAHCRAADEEIKHRLWQGEPK